MEFCKDKRVCFFVAETIPSCAGSGISAYRYANYLAHDAKTVKVFSYNYNRQQKPIEKSGDIVIERFTYFNKNLLLKLFSLPALLFNYLRASLKNDVIFIYGRYMVGFELILLLGRLPGKKVIYQSTLLHDDDPATLIEKRPVIMRSIRKWLFKGIDLFHAINPEFILQWKRIFPVVPPCVGHSQGVDEKVFTPITPNPALLNRLNIHHDESIFTILSVGILIERKGYADTFKMLETLDIDFEYLVMGQYELSDEHRSSFEEEQELSSIRHRGKTLLKERVQFLSHLPQPAPIYQTADVFIHAGYREGTPGVILEAMACGLPVIARRIPGIDFLLKHKENCLLFDTIEELRNRVLTIYRDKDFARKLAENARETILKEHTYKHLSERIGEALYAR